MPEKFERQLMQNGPIEDIERQELIQKLIDKGFSDLVSVMLDYDNQAKVYTKRGRLNKSGACRQGGWKTK